MYIENMEVQSKEPTTTRGFPMSNICLKYPNQQLETTRAYELNFNQWNQQCKYQHLYGRKSSLYIFLVLTKPTSNVHRVSICSLGLTCLQTMNFFSDVYRDFSNNQTTSNKNTWNQKCIALMTFQTWSLLYFACFWAWRTWEDAC